MSIYSYTRSPRKEESWLFTWTDSVRRGTEMMDTTQEDLYLKVTDKEA